MEIFPLQIPDKAGEEDQGFRKHYEIPYEEQGIQAIWKGDKQVHTPGLKGPGSLAKNHTGPGIRIQEASGRKGIPQEGIQFPAGNPES